MRIGTLGGTVAVKGCDIAACIIRDAAFVKTVQVIAE